MAKLTVREQFDRYHAANPHVYDLFRRFAREARESGRTRFGAKSIIERIRWEVATTTEGEFKILNAVTPYYARMLIAEDATFTGFFVLRPADADRTDCPDQTTEGEDHGGSD